MDTTERPGKHRLLVLTDISSLTARVREPDDGQSLIRLLLYSSEIDIEGLIASSNLGHGQVCRPELIRAAVDAYEEVRPSLRRHHPDYPSGAYLRERIQAGQPVAGPKVPVFDSIGAGKDTEASEWIIRAVDRPDPRPLWVAIWGGSADLAQTLWRVRETRDPKAVQAFVARLRVHSIYDQDATGAWIKASFPDLFVITRHHGVRGMYRGGDGALVGPEWVETHIRSGHGPLGALYPNYDGGDIWSSRLGRVRGIKEGDTPSFLGLIPNGLGDPDEPARGGWGGRFEGSGRRFVDARDDLPGIADDPDPRMAAVYRWRPAFQADFQARLDWCVKPFAGANHPPVVRIEGEMRRAAHSGETITLDAGASSDPEGDRLRFAWSVYPEMEGAGPPLWEGRNSPVVRVTVPCVDRPRLLPLLLTVRDDGSPPLTRYGRVFVTVTPKP